MNLLIKKFATALLLFVLKERIERTLCIARIETARGILLGADTLRVLLGYLFLFLIATATMGAGLALFMVGLCTMATMHLMDPEFFDLFFWIPLGFCFGGLLCFIPSFLLLSYKLLSEEAWLKVLKKNKVLGPFLCSVLEEARASQNKRS